MDNLDDAPQKIGLVLSGGGIRAVLFHAGVLRWMAENSLIENVEHISSVSGGSLFVGLVYHFSNYKWPSSDQYLNSVLPQLKFLMVKKSLQKDSMKRLISKLKNWKFCLSRANIVSQSIERLWEVNATMGCLPQKPIWSINGTTAEDGRRFRIKGTQIGNYEIGYAEAPDLQLASAMAVSIAFPGAIGPLVINTNNYNWFKRNTWDTSEPPKPVIPKFKKLHLYDGGIYDNLGIEPFFDGGRQNIKAIDPAINNIILSDAGAPFTHEKIPSTINPSRFKRISNIAQDQIRSLRVRSFVNFIQNNPEKGMYLQIGSDPLKKIKQFKPQIFEEAQKQFSWLDNHSVNKAALHKTHLDKVDESDFSLLDRHGYETALWNNLAFGNTYT